MGLFDKKYCDFCGKKIGLFGNNKLKDANMCDECARKLSPWFTNRRQSTKAEIQKQMSYRESNQQAVNAFHITRTLGKDTKLYLDEDNRKFMVTNARDLRAANPDVLDFSQVTGCDFDIDEDRNELMREGKDGKEFSYNPPRYEYSYDFDIIIHVNHPYFNEMRFALEHNVETGQTPMGAAPAMGQANFRSSWGAGGITEYNECLRIGNEIKEKVDGMRKAVRQEIKAKNAPKTAVTCPYCGATTFPDASGCCEYCGSALKG
jgi:hypothetical protein